MGFNPATSFQATKIYLNDIESAVNYCTTYSAHISDTSDTETSISDKSCISDITCEPGSLLSKCCNILTTKYPEFLLLFKQWFVDEEFEDKQLIDEFAADNIDESFFIQYIKDNYHRQCNLLLLKQLYLDISNVINSNELHSDNQCKLQIINENNRNNFRTFEEKLVDAFICNIQSIIDPIFGVIPLSIFLLCYRYFYIQTVLCINFKDLPITIDKCYIEDINTLYSNQCNVIYPDILRENEEYFNLFTLFMIGKDNNIPLLTYLVDAYNRYYIQRMKSLFTNNIKSKHLLLYRISHEFERIDESKFINNKCKAFVDICIQRVQSKNFRDVCVESMKYIMDSRRISKPSLINLSIYRIDDKIIDFSFCILESYLFISKILSKKYHFPLQFDVMIIPQRVTKYDKIVNDNIGDIDSKLLNANLNYFVHHDINCESFSDLMFESASKLLNKNKNERLLFAVDRRDEDNHKLYTYQPLIQSRKIESNYNRFINESLWNNSIESVLPYFGGAKEEANGYMFMISFHVISKYSVRVYLYIDTFGTRFFLQDITQYYLSQFFVCQQSKLLKELINCSSERANRFKTKYKQCKDLINDNKFEQFYKYILSNEKKSPF